MVAPFTLIFSTSTPNSFATDNILTSKSFIDLIVTNTYMILLVVDQSQDMLLCTFLLQHVNSGIAMLNKLTEHNPGQLTYLLKRLLY